jgi:uncharacterized protein YkwD
MPFGVLRWKIPVPALAVPLLLLMVLTTSTGLLSPKKAEALDSEEQIFLSTINSDRAQNGLGPLTENATLDGVAQWMSNDMATHNYFAHEDSQGRDPFARMDDLGYGYNTWRGENLVAGVETSSEAFRMWSQSPPHKENMLGPNYTVIGIARAYSASSTFGWYWATEFGGEDDSAPPPPAPTAEPVPPTAPPQFVTPAPAPAPDPTQVPPPPAPTTSPAPTPAPTRYPVHTGLFFEGEPPIDIGHRAGGTFLAGLLELAPAVDRALFRDAVRVVR